MKATDENRAFRVLVLAPIGRDAAATADLLRKAGLGAQVVNDLGALSLAIASGAGAVIVAEEALFNADLTVIERWISDQPVWSDLPFVVLTSHFDHSKIKLWRQSLVARLRNVFMLERPLQPVTLTSALQAALRARRRQYEIEALIAARDEAAQNLESLVAARTLQLEAANAGLKNEMSERERLEASLRQAQKMEAVGQLTGGLAHDFNNLLTGISGSLELIQTRLAQGRVESVDRYITAAQNAVKRAAALTHRLLAFSRRQTLGGLWSTFVDANQLENALLNLCINARDAMPGGSVSVASDADPCR
jgi:signal transduction histidine kinase